MILDLDFITLTFKYHKQYILKERIQQQISVDILHRIFYLIIILLKRLYLLAQSALHSDFIITKNVLYLNKLPKLAIFLAVTITLIIIMG